MSLLLPDASSDPKVWAESGEDGVVKEFTS